MLLILEKDVANNKQSPFVTQYIQRAANGTGRTLVLVFSHAHIMFDFFQYDSFIILSICNQIRGLRLYLVVANTIFFSSERLYFSYGSDSAL